MKLIKFFPLLILIFISCNKHDVSNCSSARQKIVLIYMAGDNNLSREVYDEIGAIKSGWQSYNGRVIIYGDTKDKDPFLIEIKSGTTGAIADTLKKYPQHNSAAAATLKSVVDDVTALNSQASFGLIVFSHGSGWLPTGIITSLNEELLLKNHNLPILTYTLAQDNNNELPLADFVAAIPDNRFEYIIFENCFMGGVEIAAALENKAQWVMGSSAETLAPGFAPVYPKLLSSLFNCKENTETNLKAFANTFVSYFKSLQGVKQSATMSVFKMSEFGALTSWVKKNAPYKPVDITNLQRFDRFSNDRFFFDLQEYLQLISNPASHAELANILSKLVVYKDATSNFMVGYPGSFTIVKHSGLTTYIPQEKYTALNEEYKKTSWYQKISN